MRYFLSVLQKYAVLIIILLISTVSLAVGSYSLYLTRKIIAVIPPEALKTYPKPEKILGELPVDIHVLGNPEAELALIEFADYQCPFCGKFFSEVFPQIKREYIDTGKVKLIYLDSPFLGDESREAANAAWCAGEQDKFWQYHDELFKNQKGENQGAFRAEVLRLFGRTVGLEMEPFDSCIESKKYYEAIEAHKSLGVEYGVTGTPRFFIGKQTIKGAAPFKQFKEVIDEELSR